MRILYKSPHGVKKIMCWGLGVIYLINYFIDVRGDIRCITSSQLRDG